MTKTQSEINTAIRDAYHCDQKALEIARQIDDIYAIGGLHVAQRTSRIQLLIKDGLVSWVRSTLQRNNIPEDNFR